MTGGLAIQLPCGPVSDAAPIARWPRASRVDVTGETRDTTAGVSDAWAELYAWLRRDRNDPEAFAELERRVARWVEFQLTSPSCRSEHEDVIAETCAAVLLGLDEAHGPGTFAGFVYGHYQNARRRARQYTRLPASPLEDRMPSDPGDDGPTPDELALLERCLAELPPRERRAVELRYFHDASSSEIAAALGLTETNARRVVFNGLAHLRRSAQHAWPDGRCAPG